MEVIRNLLRSAVLLVLGLACLGLAVITGGVLLVAAVLLGYVNPINVLLVLFLASLLSGVVLVLLALRGLSAHELGSNAYKPKNTKRG
ncbi:MAG: hypothetical protein QW356_03910 [Candidatus Hadarchaeales archaeon]